MRGLAISLLLLSVVFSSLAATQVSETLLNYQDGAVLEHSSALGQGNVVTHSVVGERTAQQTDVNYIDREGNKIQAIFTTEDMSQENPSMSAIVSKLALGTFLPSEAKSGAYIEYLVKLDEARKVLGENSFVYNEMKRCGVESITVEISQSPTSTDIRIGSYRKVFDKASFPSVLFCE
jgi:hypothetical protein